MSTFRQIVPFAREYGVGDVHFLNEMQTRNMLDVFDDRVLNFFDSVSKSLMKHPDIGRVPEIVALAFWLRKSNLSGIVKEHEYLRQSDRYRIYPLGTVFHICPANVDTMFLYSLAISLLTGNKNILRVSTKLNESYVMLIFDVINEQLRGEHGMLAPYIRIVNYERNDEINAWFSQKSDARILWGGDDTINTFRKTESNVRGKDLVFADRYSASLISSNTWIGADNGQRSKMAELLYNDAYSFDQKGCSCPQLLFFLGSESENKTTETELYELLLGQAKTRYQSDVSSLASLKLMQESGDAIRGSISAVINDATELIFSRLAENVALPENCGGGYFYVRYIQNIEDIGAFLDKRFQTLTHWGFDAGTLQSIAEISAQSGIDRIVPVGRALEFGHIWDGYNLIEELTSRKLVLT